jgi:hypothetical protein
MTARLFQGASYLDFTPCKRVSSSLKSRPGGGKRGVVKGLSRQSRNNLLKEFSKVQRVHLVSGLFLTLTYHWKEDYGSLVVSKRHLDNFFKRVRYKFPDAAWIWRLEPQARGVAHYHVLMLGVTHMSHEWLASVWNKIAAPGDSAHLAAGTQVKRVKSYKHASAYLGKYLSKDSGSFGDDLPGRMWGSGGKMELYVGQVVQVRIDGASVASVFRIMDRYRLSVARARTKGRASAISYARRRRFDYKRRWYLCDVNALLRVFME